MINGTRSNYGKFLSSVSSLIFFGLALGPACADTQPPAPLHLKGVILTPAGKPAADAAIVYALIDFRTQSVAQEKVLHPAADGTFDIVFTPSGDDDPRFPLLYVTAPEGVALPGFAYTRSGPTRMTVTLTPATRVRVRLRDEAGLPLAGVRVSPLALLRDREYSSWNGAVTDYLSAVTDKDGVATLAGLPQGWTLRLAVVGSGWVQPEWSQNIALAKAAVTPDAAVQVARGGSLSGVVLYGPAQPAAQVAVTAVPLGNGGGIRQNGTTDSAGHYQITGMPRGSYTVSIEGHQGAPSPGPWEWTAAAQSAAVTAGSDTSGISFTLIHGGILSGTVTDIKIGKPISGVRVYVDGPGGGQNAFTDDAGRYTLHVPPGGQRVYLEADPGMKAADPKSVVVADGQTQTADFQSTMPLHPAVVRGIVVGPTGKPVAGAKVTAAGQSQQEQDAQQVTDAQGRFSFDAPGLMPDMRLYAASGGLSTPTGTLAADGSAVGKPATLRLASHAGLSVLGRVVGADGKPVAGASATLYREHASGQDGIGVGTAKTNAAGRYQFTPVVPDATYQVGVQAEGFGYQFTKQSRASGPLLHFAPLALPRTDSFVGGTVLDVNGRPIAGADVSLMSASDKHTQTDAQGRFHLAGATRGKAIVEVRAAQGRYASIQVGSGRDDLQITAMNTDEQMVESKRFTAALEADKTNHGDGTAARTLLRSACAQASSGNKKVLLVFHASWCGPCFLLHRFLEDPQVKPVLDAHFVVQDLDIWENEPHKDWDNPGGEDLYKQYGGVRPSGGKQGVPFFAVLTPAGTSLGDARLNGDNIGYPSDPAAAAFFLKTLKTAAPEMTDAEIATLKTGLQRYAKI